jgi:hypothetical protein
MIIALTGTIALTSCIRNTPEDLQELLEVKFAGHVLQASTASAAPSFAPPASVWGVDDRIGIYMINADPGTLAEDYILVENRQLAATGGATTSFYALEGGPMLFPVDPNESVRFVAYRPFSENVTADFMLPIDLTDQNDQSKLEILHVPVTTQSFNRSRAEAVPLEFRHQLTKLVFQITNGAGVSTPVEDGLEIRITNQRTEGEFNLANGAISTSEDLSEIVTHSAGEGTTVTAEAVVFPGSTASVQLLIINNAGQEFTVNLPTTSWTNSTLYTYTITLTAVPSGAPLTATLSDGTVSLVGLLR